MDSLKISLFGESLVRFMQFRIVNQTKRDGTMVKYFFSVMFLMAANVSHSLEVTAYRFDGKTKSVISDYFASSNSVAFGMSLSSDLPFVGSLTYLIDGVEVADIPIKFDAGQRFMFPNETNFVQLDDLGSHTFLIYRGQELAEQREIVVLADQNSNTSDLATLASRSSISKPGFFANAKYRSDVKTRILSVEMDRGAGSKIYKSKVDSVVLIVAGEGFGTGSIISADGMVLTNWHVVGDQKQVTVLFKPQGFSALDSAENYVADVIKLDRTKDLALIKIKAFNKVVSPIEISSGESIEIAQDVHAIGHPRGNYWTYTRGVISQIRPAYEWQSDEKLVHKADVLQTQTPINPGNSGGPLLDDDGVMVGVNSFVDLGADGLNYAVAATAVNQFLNSNQGFQSNDANSANVKTTARELDLNGDGSVDVWAFDENENGIFERFDVDEDYDGIADKIMIDENENEIAEIIIYYIQTADGETAVVMLDDDEDGNPDRTGYDFDMDGELDKIEVL